MQATSVSYDSDNGVLQLKLDTGEEYQITNAGHARAVRDKISVGGVISGTQHAWLAQYRTELREANREQLRARLRKLREELRQ